VQENGKGNLPSWSRQGSTGGLARDEPSGRAALTRYYLARPTLRRFEPQNVYAPLKAAAVRRMNEASAPVGSHGEQDESVTSRRNGASRHPTGRGASHL
jgi:hypothetical protein